MELRTDTPAGCNLNIYSLYIYIANFVYGEHPSPSSRHGNRSVNYDALGTSNEWLPPVRRLRLKGQIICVSTGSELTIWHA
jgi:hypothetical protein